MSRTYLIGGMVYDSTGHSATDSVKTVNRLRFSMNSFDVRRKLSKKRAFACAVNIMDEKILVLGGLTDVGGGLEESGEMVVGGGSVPDMIHPRSETVPAST